MHWKVELRKHKHSILIIKFIQNKEVQIGFYQIFGTSVKDILLCMEFSENMIFYRVI